MSKKIFAILFAALLTLGLFCLPVSAEPAQEDMASLTPYDLIASALPGENGVALLAVQIDGLGADMPGMEPGDDIHTLVEYKRGDGEWQPYNSYGSKMMLDDFQTPSGEFQLRFDWVFDKEWDGWEPIYFRVYCEYMEGGIIGTGLVSGYSNVAFIGVAGRGETTTRPEPQTFLPKEPRDTEEPTSSFAPPAVPGVDYTLLIIVGIGLLLLLIIIIIVISKKKRKNP